jgi:hypothetical protein
MKISWEAILPFSNEIAFIIIDRFVDLISLISVGKSVCSYEKSKLIYIYQEKNIFRVETIVNNYYHWLLYLLEMRKTFKQE